MPFVFYLIIIYAESERRTEGRRRKDGVVRDGVDGSFRDFDEKIDTQSVDQQTPRIDLHAKGVAQRM